MKKLWRQATGRIKDRNSQWMASLARRSSHRNPDLEVVVIKATSHDDTFVDYQNAQRVFTWVRTSPVHLKTVLWALTRRVKRTRDWVVVLKSLIVLHGILCTKAPGINKIGRLPFDLSGFDDAYTRNGLYRWAHNTFVRAYFAFVDLKSVVMADEPTEETVGPMLVGVQRWQDILDAVLEVRPQRKAMMDNVVVMEAMECMIIELFELYSKICDGIATGLMKIYTDKLGKEEATIALNVLQKATRQGQDLSDYFEYCRRFGLLHDSECPKIEEIPREDFAELERIIKGEILYESTLSEKVDSEDSDYKGSLMVVGEKRHIDTQEINKPWLKTVITNKWEVFDDDVSKFRNGNGNENVEVMIDPFAASYSFPLVSQSNHSNVYGGRGTPISLL